MTWAKIGDNNVRHHWKCPDCDAEHAFTPDCYQDIGTPMCAECEQNMDYEYTEVVQQELA